MTHQRVDKHGNETPSPNKYSWGHSREVEENGRLLKYDVDIRVKNLALLCSFTIVEGM